MDGHYVPNITFGPDIVKAIRKYSAKCFDAHLMISPVDPFLEAFAAREPTASPCTPKRPSISTARCRQSVR